MATPLATRYVASRPVALGLVKLFLLVIAQLPLISAAPTFFTTRHLTLLHDSELDPKSPDDPELWLNLSIAAALVLSGGAFAGLTIALMGQDEVYLQVIQSSGTSSERKNAASVLNLLQKGKHWVLVTLLLSNVITNETLPIVLDRSLGGGWPAVLGSTILIVIFGEIVPQSICVRFGLPIGAWMAPCVLTLMYIMSPVAWPVAKLLDKLLGKDHGTIYKKAGLKTLVTLHKTLGEAGEQLNSDEVTIISAVLDLKEKSVGSIMTPMEDVFTMSADTVLDEKTMDLILSQGYSRIPIYAPDNPMNFVGMLLVKMLITYDPEDCKLVRDFALATLPETRPETSCLDIVNFFQEGKSHMVLVSEYPGEDRGAFGVVTLEDVIEELIGEEIIDESDVFIDVHKAIRRMAPAPNSRVPKGRIVEEPPPTLSSVPQPEFLETDGSALTPKMPPIDRRRNSVEAPQPRFQLRLQTSDKNSDSTDGWVTQRGATDEILEHLKHLGPSNLASRPRQTRYQNVKIKRAASPTRSAQTDLESDSQTRQTPSFGFSGGIGAGLVHSAGLEASDGVHALNLGYGTMTNQSTDNVRDMPIISIPEALHEEHDDQPRSRGSPAASSTSSGSHSRPREHAKSASAYRHNGPARSGSITEQIVDVNGIRKVVLHTHNNTTSDGENSSPTNPKFPVRQDGHIVDLEDKTDTSRTSEAKKKKRRRKHKKPSNEQEPLLSK